MSQETNERYDAICKEIHATAPELLENDVLMNLLRQYTNLRNLYRGALNRPGDQKVIPGELQNQLYGISMETSSIQADLLIKLHSLNISDTLISLIFYDEFRLHLNAITTPSVEV